MGSYSAYLKYPFLMVWKVSQLMLCCNLTLHTYVIVSCLNTVAITLYIIVTAKLCLKCKEQLVLYIALWRMHMYIEKYLLQLYKFDKTNLMM